MNVRQTDGQGELYFPFTHIYQNTQTEGERRVFTHERRQKERGAGEYNKREEDEASSRSREETQGH